MALTHQGRAVASVRLLGPIQVVLADGATVDLPSVSQRRLLAILGLSVGRPLRPDLLSEYLGVTNGGLRTAVARLRSQIGADNLQTHSAGYLVTCRVDAKEFTRLLDDRSGRANRLAGLDEALALWAGDALDEFRHESWAVAESARLEELRCIAIEERSELLIAGPRGAEAVVALYAHVSKYPLRDRPRGLLLAALASEGRQADALRAFQEYRSFLAEEVGTEPSAFVVAMERRIANGWVGDATIVGDQDRTARPTEPTLRGNRSPLTPLDGALTHQSTMIGRTRQLAALNADLVNARAGTLRTIVLSGEAGIGKTTLLGAFAQAVHRDGGTVLYGRCDKGAAVPFQPFRDIVGQLVDAAPIALLHAHCQRCDGVLRRLAPQLEKRNAAWRTPEATLPTDDGTERHQLFEAVADLIRRVALLVHEDTALPLVLILDDVHWAEPTALLLLRHCVRYLVDAPVLIAVSLRDSGEHASDELRATLAVVARSKSRRIPLLGFDDGELTDLAVSVTTGALGTPSFDLIEHLRNETAGNPLYAAHLIRHLVDAGKIVRRDGTAEFSVRPQDLVDASEIPPSLRDIVWSRVRALGVQASDVLCAASVLGAGFSEDLLVGLLDISDADVASILDASIAAGLLVEMGSAARTLRFTHALVWHALSLEVRGARRRRLHERAAQVLEKSADVLPQSSVVELAKHWASAGRWTEALRWSTAAGDYAFDHLAPSEAAHWYEVALQHALSVGRSEAEITARTLRLGEAQHRAGDRRSHRTLMEAATMAQRSGDADVLVRAALADDRESVLVGSADRERLGIVEAALAACDPTDDRTYARLLARLARELIHTSQSELRERTVAQALELADRSSDPTLIAEIVPPLLHALWAPGTLHMRRSLAARATAVADATIDPFLQFRSHMAAYMVAIESADPVAADRSKARLVSLADRVDESRFRWMTSIVNTFEATMGANLDDAESHAARSFAISTELGDSEAFVIYAGQIFVTYTFAGRHTELFPLVERAMKDRPKLLGFRLAYAIICVVVGRGDEAQQILDEGSVDGFSSLPDDFLWKTSVIGYAILAIELGDVRAAAQLYSILEPYGCEVSYNGATSQGYIGAYLGKLASLLGRHDVADAHLLEALSVATAFGWEYHRATTLVALALCRFRRLGTLDSDADGWLREASAICAQHNLKSVAAQIELLRC